MKPDFTYTISIENVEECKQKVDELVNKLKEAKTLAKELASIDLKVVADKVEDLKDSKVEDRCKKSITLTL